MKLKYLIILIASITSATCAAPLVISDVRYNLGTNGYDLFCGIVTGEDTNTIYMWQINSDLNTDNWLPTIMPFRGHADADIFWTAITHGETNKFYRIITIGNLVQPTNVIEYTNTFNVTNFPSQKFPPIPGVNWP